MKCLIVLVVPTVQYKMLVLVVPIIPYKMLVLVACELGYDSLALIFTTTSNDVDLCLRGNFTSLQIMFLPYT